MVADSAENDVPTTPAGGHPASGDSVCRAPGCGEVAAAPPAGRYDDARAWKDNYDGMFWRWAECDTERLQWKRRALDAETQVRLLREQAGVFPPGVSHD